jgi:glycosyltransferase involved in cell wall biosynthesis
LNLQLQGWLHYPQSFALVTGNHLLDLEERSNVQASFLEWPAPPEKFLKRGRVWARTDAMWGADIRARFARIENRAAQTPEYILRVAFPYDFKRVSGTQTSIFAVTENGGLGSGMISGGKPLKDSLPPDVRLITPSMWSAEGLVKSGALDSQISIVPHGVDTRVFKPFSNTEEREAARERLGWSNRFVVLNVSALSRRKGAEILMWAFGHLASRHDDVLLVLKGTDAVYASRSSVTRLGSRLTERARETIAPRVRYLGATLSDEEMAMHYAAADVLAAPYHAEGFNMPVLEAMACGLPVICTGGGPTDEFATGDGVWMTPSQPGPGEKKDSLWLYPDVDTFSDQLETAYGSESFASAARQSSPAIVREAYTWTKVTDRLLQVLEQG